MCDTSNFNLKNEDNFILKSLPFIIYQQNNSYPIMHIMVGINAEVYCHIFNESKHLVIFQNDDELNDFHKDFIQHYISTFIKNYYNFILKNVNNFDDCFDLIKFFKVEEEL